MSDCSVAELTTANMYQFTHFGSASHLVSILNHDWFSGRRFFFEWTTWFSILNALNV